MTKNLQFDFDADDKIIDQKIKLNNRQLEVVNYKTGPLLVIAGAGTGKTAVITHRIANIIAKKWARSSEILALTFTDKAAAEMEGRVDQLVPYGYTDIWISTFHAFGDRFLRDYAIDLGLPANFKVLTQTEQAIFLRQNIYAFDLNYFRPIADPLSHIYELLNHFSRLKDELISPEDYLTWVQDQRSKIKDQNDKDEIQIEKNLELAKAYSRYQELMIQSGNLDFGDQIFLVYKLLSENKKVLKECRKKFRYILVDEFQDTNFAQNEIVKLLAGVDVNIMVVADDDQAIYRFRGASISNVLNFKDSYKNVKQIVLKNNFRSSQEILDGAYRLIQNNNPDRLEVQNKIDKKLKSNFHGAEPELLFCQTLSAEADKVVEKIVKLKEKGDFKNNEFAILVRANNQSEPFIQALTTKGIPAIFSGASGLYTQPEIKMILAFLKTISFTDDNLAFYQLATSDIYQISHDLISEVYTKSRRENRSISNLVKDNKKFVEISADIKKFRQKINEPVGEILYEYLTEKSYLKNLTADLSIENEQKIFNIAKFFDTIAQFNHSSDERGVLEFLENLELIIDAGGDLKSAEVDRDFDAVNILTVHSAKGLEWPVVFVVNCVADRFPSRNRREQLPIPDELIKERLPEGDWHLQEERRLFYVAATRAKNYLFFTAAEDYGGKRAKKISPFVLEFLAENQPEKLKHSLSPEEKINRFKKLPRPKADRPLAGTKFSSEILKLSRQQIDDYFSCPKKFYFAHIIKIPLLENQNLMYGTAIHAALDHYFRRKINGDRPTLNQLIADYEQAFKNVGFISRQQEELRHNQGISTLTNFYDRDQKDSIVPSAVEEVFEFADENVKVVGRFDLVRKIADDAEICDFKTSDVREQKDADRRIKESTQMMIYALAWREKYQTIPKTTLFFIESGLKGERQFSDKEIDATRQMILAVAAGIRKSDFSAQPDIFQCKYCPYKEICPEAI
ncbi:MAG: ATP-dependent DNA helicase [Candidatus Berkelbacteria bacterium]|nr:ATP-dependent DNA helicase [Candidatus Berkelbacteria bacterium]